MPDQVKELGPWILVPHGRIVRGEPGDKPWCPDYWGGAAPSLRWPADAFGELPE